MHRRFSSFLAALGVVMLACCTSTDPDLRNYASASSEHFILYYEESEVSQAEAARILSKKERLLAYINEYYGLAYDGVIETYLDARYGFSYAYPQSQRAMETRSYALSDNGHEIAHIVVDNSLGVSYNTFLSEGFAVAAELPDEWGGPIQEFADYRAAADSGSGQLDTTWRTRYHDIYDQMLEGYFSSSYFEYLRAGAFVAYLRMRFGVAPLKQLYTASIASRSMQLRARFEELFGHSLIATIDDFYEYSFQ